MLCMTYALEGNVIISTNIFKANSFDLRTVLLEIFPYSVYVHILLKYYL